MQLNKYSKWYLKHKQSNCWEPSSVPPVEVLDDVDEEVDGGTKYGEKMAEADNIAYPGRPVRQGFLQKRFSWTREPR